MNKQCLIRQKHGILSPGDTVPPLWFRRKPRMQMPNNPLHLENASLTSSVGACGTVGLRHTICRAGSPAVGT